MSGRGPTKADLIATLAQKDREIAGLRLLINDSVRIDSVVQGQRDELRAERDWLREHCGEIGVTLLRLSDILANGFLPRQPGEDDGD